jgi:sterol desaturase/sphingolipid hydroxylase (fatty acid hydroxylase superfamily)
MPEALLHWLQTASWPEAAAAFLVENLVIFVAVVALGGWIARRFRARPVVEPPEPVTRGEVAVALSNVLLNTAVTLAGWQMWRHGAIRFRGDVGAWALADVLVLLLAMDLLMYGLHRIAHTPLLYPLLHRLHHRYERVRPLTLFALHPVENLAFGALWLAVISIYSASWAGMSAYMALNVAFGAVGHLGVEPLPSAWARKPVVRHLAGSSFHAQHHQDVGHNYGFYTLVWDRLFGTLRPDYAEVYGRVAAGGDADVSISFERGPCLFHCATYTIEIDPDRSVTYEGKKYAPVAGRKTYTISAEAYAAIVAAVERAHVDRLRSRYEGGHPDAPSITLRITRGDRTREIYHYLGSEDAPEELKDLEEAIDVNALPADYPRLPSTSN